MRIDESSNAHTLTAGLPSCARTDAKSINREVQMKYDIAKNEEGPLRRTVKGQANAGSGTQPQRLERTSESEGHQNAFDKDDDDMTCDRHPGLLERFTNIETHLSVRYGNIFDRQENLHFRH